MRKSLTYILGIALLLALATPAAAFIACEDCAGYPDACICGGTCNGQGATTCGEYRALGCTGLFSDDIPELDLQALESPVVVEEQEVQATEALDVLDREE
ncbi:MAG: hypothetical protein SX243_03855 [Acidobacteriota bacterium]|nr:hypothetical protein [Acidobacteriota bacterium]